MTTSPPPVDAWGELRSLLHTHYPSFPSLWRCVMSLEGDERHAAARYTASKLGMIAPGLTGALDVFEREVLEAWLTRMTLGQLWRHLDMFALHDALLEHALADLALREHVHAGAVSAEALTARREELVADGTYHALGARSEWVQGMMRITLEVDVTRAVRDMHHHIAQWNALPKAQQQLEDEVRGGLGRARDTLLGGRSRGGGVLPSLLGGGSGIGQLLGASVNVLRDASQSLTRMGSAFTRSKEEALSELEDLMVGFCLDHAMNM